MLQARVLLCLSLAAVQVWAQGAAGSGSGQSGSLTDEPLKCFQGNPWWTFMNNTSGDACHIALQMRKTSGLGSTPSGATTTILMHPENPQLCLPVVYDMYGACMTCQESSPPPNHMMPSWADWCNSTAGTSDLTTIRDIEALAPDWTKRVDFTDSVWDLNLVRAAAESPATTSGLAPPTPTNTSGVGEANPIDSSSSHKSSNIGPIVGGVIGGLALISIGVAVLFLYLRRRRNKVAPSSEFTRYIQTGGTHVSTRPETALSGTRGSIPRQDSATIPLTAGEDEVLEAPPAFTPGQYTGPVFEKDGYRADPNAPLYSSGNASSQPSHSQHGPVQGPSGSS
ncbi:hypothetical protein FRC04_000011 [Tulasnella sp. 424]|nr:hypothetical protein FRC04_000011 [Tulasnella sp. 424]